MFSAELIKQHSETFCSHVTLLGRVMELCHQTMLFWQKLAKSFFFFFRWQERPQQQHAGHRHQGPFPTCTTPAEEAEEGQESTAAG